MIAVSIGSFGQALSFSASHSEAGRKNSEGCRCFRNEFVYLLEEIFPRENKVAGVPEMLKMRRGTLRLFFDRASL